MFTTFALITTLVLTPTFGAKEENPGRGVRGGAVEQERQLTHTWDRYKWKTASLNVENKLSVLYSDKGIQVWNISDSQSPLSLTVAKLSTGICGQEVQYGKIIVCDADFGETGWLGMAQIWATTSTGEIVQARALMNNHYMGSGSGSKYDSNIWRNYVTCQEVGHDFGLGHQDEDFGVTVDPHTCMDYVGTPDSDHETPNKHDYDLLTEMYSGGGGNGGGGNKPCNPKKEECIRRLKGPPAEKFGEEVFFKGGIGIYVRVDPNDAELEIYTHVTWTIEAAEEHGNTGAP
jgi:hypothetical protein